MRTHQESVAKLMMSHQESVAKLMMSHEESVSSLMQKALEIEKQQMLLKSSVDEVWSLGVTNIHKFHPFALVFPV